jgi:ParB-like chromosome segregation protein Spo0J
MKPITDDVRVAELNRLEEQARKDLQRTHSVFFKGANHNLPVFKLDIGFAKFRMENGRTKRKQLEFVHKNPDRAGELSDASSASAQAIQQAILQEMATESDLLELLKQGQHEPLLLRYDGYVVNGNRRLAAMRLLHSDPKSHTDFSHVDVARLPVLEEKEIRRIEQRLQMSQDGKADYNWVDELLTIQSNIDDFAMSIQELAKDMNKRKPTIENQQRMLLLIDMYLEKTDKSGQYFVVEGDEQAFKTLAQSYAKLAGDTVKQLQLLDLAFPIIAFSEAGESKHNRIRKIADNLPSIMTKIVQATPSTSEVVPASPTGDLLDELPAAGGKQSTLDVRIDVASSELIHDAIRTVDREIEVQDEANGPAAAVEKAATLLKNIKITPSMARVKQVRGQLKAIRSTCETLLAELEGKSPGFDQ